jgi:hypothetical protein
MNMNMTSRKTAVIRMTIQRNNIDQKIKTAENIILTVALGSQGSCQNFNDLNWFNALIHSML